MTLLLAFFLSAPLLHSWIAALGVVLAAYGMGTMLGQVGVWLVVALVALLAVGERSKRRR